MAELGDGNKSSDDSSDDDGVLYDGLERSFETVILSSDHQQSQNNQHKENAKRKISFEMDSSEENRDEDSVTENLSSARQQSEKKRRQENAIRKISFDIDSSEENGDENSVIDVDLVDGDKEKVANNTDADRFIELESRSTEASTSTETNSEQQSSFEYISENEEIPGFDPSSVDSEDFVCDPTGIVTRYIRKY